MSAARMAALVLISVLQCLLGILGARGEPRNSRYLVFSRNRIKIYVCLLLSLRGNVCALKNMYIFKYSVSVLALKCDDSLQKNCAYFELEWIE